MKPQLRLTCLPTQCLNFSGTGNGRFMRLAPAARKASGVVYSSRFSPSASARPSCRLQSPYLNHLSASLLTGRAAFSTSPASKSTRGAKPQGTTEADEGAPVAPPAGGKAAFPERLVIYHAGTGKTTFLACLKVTTLFIFGFFDMIMAPAYIAAGEPLLNTAGVALCGLIPAAYVAWSTSPFVAAMHLHLPPYARWSRAILERFARTAPPNTRLDVTTMSLIGKPRVSSMVLSDLRPEDRRLGMVNYVRDTSIADAERKWWRFKAVGEFNVHGETGVKTGWVWKEVREGIARRSGVAAAAAAGQGQGVEVKGKTEKGKGEKGEKGKTGK